MPTTAAYPPALARRVFRGSEAVARGLLTPRQLQSRRWTRLYRDVYVDAELPVDHGVRIAAAGLLLPPKAVFAGRTAAWLRGVDALVEPDDPVEVLALRPARFGAVAGLRIHTCEHFLDSEVHHDLGRRLTTPGRTATDVARWAPNVSEAVVALDLMLRTRAVGPTQLARAADAIRCRRGRHQAKVAADLADGRSESPQESRLRVPLVLAGLPPAVPQYEVRIGVRFVARVDLAYPDRRLAIEYDGAWHGEAGQFARDRQRLNRLGAAGWRVVHVTADDLHTGAAVALVRAALAA